MKGKKFSIKKVIAMMIMAVMVFQCIGGGGTILAAEDGNTDYQMNEAITNVSIQAKVDGGWYEIPQVFSDSMPAIERDAEIRVAISYEPSKLSTDFKAGDTISYQLPSGIKAMASAIIVPSCSVTILTAQLSLVMARSTPIYTFLPCQSILFTLH